MRPSPRPSVPSDLARRIAEARVVLDRHPDGRLPLPQRRRVREPFGARQRVELARLAAERVLPIWYAEAPGDHGPAEMLMLAGERLSGRIGEREAEELGDRFRTHVDDLVYRRQISLRAQAAGEAARLVVSEVDLDDYDGEPPDIDDDDLDPEAWDPAYVAAVAAAGYPDEDVEARRAFWRWYLDEGVPEAWRSG
jgi:Immunity protein Imm5